MRVLDYFDHDHTRLACRIFSPPHVEAFPGIPHSYPVLSRTLPTPAAILELRASSPMHPLINQKDHRKCIGTLVIKSPKCTFVFLGTILPLEIVDKVISACKFELINGATSLVATTDTEGSEEPNGTCLQRQAPSQR